MTKNILRVTFCAATLFTGAVAVLPAATIYSASLSGVNEVPPVVTTGTGTATLTLNNDSLNIFVLFSGLTTPDIMAHIHCCAPLGTNAPVALGFATFPTGVTAGSFNFTYDLTSSSVYTSAFLTANGGTAAGAEAALIGGLNTRQTYVNIHTTSNPGGEIRGQVSTTPEPGSYALLGSGLVGLFTLARKASSRLSSR